MIKNFANKAIHALNLRWKYFCNELSYKVKGDNRNEFEKLVQKCRILEINKDIHQWG